MSRFLGILGVLLVLGLSMGFAALNGGQRLTLRLGFVTIYRIPLSVVVFGSVILGMVIMMVAGIRSDLRVRRILRDRLAREDEEERARIYIDRNQKDLFEEAPETPEAPEVGSPARDVGMDATPPPPSAPVEAIRDTPDTSVDTTVRPGDEGRAGPRATPGAEPLPMPDLESDDRPEPAEEETRSTS